MAGLKGEVKSRKQGKSKKRVANLSNDEVFTPPVLLLLCLLSHDHLAFPVKIPITLNLLLKVFIKKYTFTHTCALKNVYLCKIYQ